jgi:hypothetical protein
VKGPWKRGKLEGIAFVSAYDGSTFCGSYVGGVREGHGTWVSDADDRYVGGWKQNQKHGYGVYEQGGGGSRYLGMWMANERCGRGVVIKPDLYYEGDFVANKLSGRGILVTGDDYVYEGEFSSDCHMHGKGKLTMPNGDHVEGVFKGRWQVCTPPPPLHTCVHTVITRVHRTRSLSLALSLSHPPSPVLTFTLPSHLSRFFSALLSFSISYILHVQSVLS